MNWKCRGLNPQLKPLNAINSHHTTGLVKKKDYAAELRSQILKA